MSVTTSLNISLSDELKEKANEQVTRRHFSNASDYVRHLIREDVEKQEAQEDLRTLLMQGLHSELSDKSPNEFFAELREYIKSKHK